MVPRQFRRLLHLAIGLGACGGTEPGEPPAPGNEVVFEGRPSPDNAEIFVANADGSGQTRLTDNDVPDTHPEWSQDGRRIYFLSGSIGSSAGLYAMNADGSDRRLLLDAFAPRAFAVSPDGSQIAVAAVGSPPDPYYQYDLFLMNIDGSNFRRLLDVPYDGCDGAYYKCADVAAIAWSADGRRIAYSTVRGAQGIVNSYIGVVDVDGSAAALLTGTGRAVAVDPAWAPDGRRIAFASGDANLPVTHLSLEVMDADGTDRRVLVDGRPDATTNSAPTWSPDGRTVLFTRCPKLAIEECALFLINVDGTGLQAVTGAPGGARDPDWSPVSRETVRPQ